jgi:hypothetical protein
MGDMVVFDKIENLGFIDIAGVGVRMENPVRVHGKILPVTSLNGFLLLAPDGMAAEAGPWRKDL